MMKNRLYEPIDNAPLIIFRIFLGLLLACETFGAIMTGWVNNILIKPKFTFSHIGMEWLQPLPGDGMYYYFAAMGVLGLLVMIGFKYRWSMGLFTIMWAGVYYMQKTSYNNHYYLLLLVCLIMFFLPAHRYASVDTKRNPSLKRLSMPAWCSWVMIFQVAIVYFYATLAKFYPDWLDGTFTRALLTQSFNNEFMLELSSQKWFYLFIAYAGIAFDGLIVPLLLYKKTRTIAFIASLVFHIFNSVTLEIGIFPFFALSFVVFFYPPDKMRRVFFRKKPPMEESTPIYENKNVLLYFFIPYFIIQLLLPIRHYFIKGDVLWTEEGHRLSWRMMLRSRSGFTDFKIIDKKTGKELVSESLRSVKRKQKYTMSTKPDMVWQMAQIIREEFKEKGIDAAVYVNSQAGINGKPLKPLIDPNVDLGAAEWDYFFHNDWMLLYDDDGNIVK